MDRRSFLKSAGLTAAGTAALTSTSALAENIPPAASGGSPKFLSVPRGGRLIPASSDLSPWSPTPSQPWDTHTINHLYRRAGFGATLAEIKAISVLTPSQAVDALLDDSLLTGSNVPADPRRSDQWLHVQPYLGNDTTQINLQMGAYATANMEIRRHWTVQMNQPKVNLREKMTLFWMNHFVVEAIKVYYPQSMYNYLSYFRQNPWGNFKQMVSDVTTMPAMLYYLDGILNYGTAPNENYAREVQELFTMGVYYKNDVNQPNYTQADVEAIALVLSGWQIDIQAAAPNVLPAKYIPAYHGTKRVSIYDNSPQQIYNLKASGASMDADLIDHMFALRGDQIAWYICSKLYQYFVYHDITGASELAIIDAMAATFKASNWELKPVISQLLKSAHFFDEGNIGAAIKSPYDHLIGLLRTFDISIEELAAGSLFYYAYQGAQELLDPPNVKGWPGYHNWLSTTTLPYRNTVIQTQLLAGSLAAIGADGYNNNHLPVVLSDSMITTWGKQFANYSGAFDDLVKEMATYLCAQTPSATALSYIKNQLPPNTYEWPALNDAEKVIGLRLITNAIMLLANFQLS